MQIPSWAANWFAASQEISRISPNPKVHYRTHKRPPNPVHIPTSHLLQIHPNIIHPSTPGLPSGLLPSGFPTKNLYTPLSSPIRATAVPPWSCSQAVCHIPLLYVQWKIADDGQKNCPKHVQFYSRNKFEKLVHLVGFIIRRLCSYSVLLYTFCWIPYTSHSLVQQTNINKNIASLTGKVLKARKWNSLARRLAFSVHCAGAKHQTACSTSVMLHRVNANPMSFACNEENTSPFLSFSLPLPLSLSPSSPSPPFLILCKI